MLKKRLLLMSTQLLVPLKHENMMTAIIIWGRIEEISWNFITHSAAHVTWRGRDLEEKWFHSMTSHGDAAHSTSGSPFSPRRESLLRACGERGRICGEKIGCPHSDPGWMMKTPRRGRNPMCLIENVIWITSPESAWPPKESLPLPTRHTFTVRKHKNLEIFSLPELVWAHALTQVPAVKILRIIFPANDPSLRDSFAEWPPQGGYIIRGWELRAIMRRMTVVAAMTFRVYNLHARGSLWCQRHELGDGGD